MSGQPAARHADPLAETNEAEWGILGFGIGLGIAVAGLLLAPVAVPAALVAGALLAGAGGGVLAGMHLGEVSEKEDGNKQIESGSPDTLIENKWAARAAIDTVVKAKVPTEPDVEVAPPGSNELLAQGSETVPVNGYPLSRLHEKDEEGSAVKRGAARTIIGGPSAQVVRPGEHLGEVPQGVTIACNIAMWGGLLLITGGSASALMANGMAIGPAVGAAIAGNVVPMGVGMAGSYVAGSAARSLGASELTARSLELGAGLATGGVSQAPTMKLALKALGPRAPAGTLPASGDPLAPKGKFVENRQDAVDYVGAHRERVDRIAGELDAKFPEQYGSDPKHRRAAAFDHDEAKVTQDPAVVEQMGLGKPVSDKLAEDFGVARSTPKDAPKEKWITEMERVDGQREGALKDDFARRGVDRGKLERGDQAVHMADKLDRPGDPVSKHAEFGRELKPLSEFPRATAQERQVALSVEQNYSRIVPDRLLYFNRKIELSRQRAVAARFQEAQTNPRVLMEVFGYARTPAETLVRLKPRPIVSHAEQTRLFTEGGALRRFNELLSGRSGSPKQEPPPRDLIPEDWDIMAGPPTYPMRPSGAKLSPAMDELLVKVQTEKVVEVPRGVDKSGLLEHLNQQEVEYGLFRELGPDGKSPGRLFLTKGGVDNATIPSVPGGMRLIYHNHPGGNWQMSQLGGDLTFIQMSNPRQQSTAIGTARGVVRQRTPNVDEWVAGPGGVKRFDPESLLLRKRTPEEIAQRAASEKAIEEMLRGFEEDAANVKTTQYNRDPGEPTVVREPPKSSLWRELASKYPERIGRGGEHQVRGSADKVVKMRMRLPFPEYDYPDLAAPRLSKQAAEDMTALYVEKVNQVRAADPELGRLIPETRYLGGRMLEQDRIQGLSYQDLWQEVQAGRAPGSVMDRAKAEGNRIGAKVKQALGSTTAKVEDRLYEVDVDTVANAFYDKEGNIVGVFEPIGVSPAQ